MKRKNSGCFWIIAFIIALAFIMAIMGIISAGSDTESKDDFVLLASTENKDLEDTLQAFAKKNKISLRIEYQGTIDMMQTLNYSADKYDAVWPSNSIWLYMLEDDVQRKIKDSKFTSINPVIFAVDKTEAEKLGFVNNPELKVADILDAVENKGLKFIMPSATQTNSGASAYLGFLSSLAGNPQVLTTEDLQAPELQEKLKTLFNGVGRSSGSEEYTLDTYLSGSYKGMVGYESSIIQINEQLATQGKTPLYALYPVDGVSLSDSPFAYVDHGNEKKKSQFKLVQDYLLSEEMQAVLTQTGRRAYYGGLVSNESSVFRADWGIKTQQYLSPVRYPSAAVIRDALNLYQDKLRKPSYTIFALDTSGSMHGEGFDELSAAMEMILDHDEASQRMIQFAPTDAVHIMSFSSDVGDETFYAGDGDIDDVWDLNSFVERQYPNGGTNIYLPVLNGLENIPQEFLDTHSVSIILMTDGQSNSSEGLKEIRKLYASGTDIPIFSITFGEADPKELEVLAELSGGKVFDGKANLVGAFQTVRGYN